jgi:hypothetical protein
MRALCVAVAAVLSLASPAALALPMDWSPFISCTREFAPMRPHPAGHYETVVVAIKVISKCYVQAPPPGLPPPPGETGPNRPGPGLRDDDEVACDKIEDRKRALQERLTDIRYEERALETAINDGESALRVADEVSRVLEADARSAQQACDRAQANYQAEVVAMFASISTQCRPRRPPEVVQDCIDEKLAQAEALLAGGNAEQLATQRCAVARSVNEYFQRQAQVRAALAQELSRWEDQRRALMRERWRIQSELRALAERQKSGDCKR